MATSSKPVTVWVACYDKGDPVCGGTSWVMSKRSGFTDPHDRPRRFVAIDSLPEPLRRKVREACR